MKKRLLALSLAATLILPLHALAGGKSVSWYVRRNGNRQPTDCTMSAEELREYDAYYLDTRHGADSSDKVIYLTFDAGYENGNVKKILDTLKRENVPGAFFILSNLILKNPDLLERMANEGHLVCNHTKNHRNMAECTPDAMRKNLTDLENLYREKTGRELAKYFRFPEGTFSKEALTVAKDMGYKTVFWSFGYADWDNEKQPDSASAIKKILGSTHNGMVILLHPTSATNAEILPELIRHWKAEGYRFGTLDELCK